MPLHKIFHHNHGIAIVCLMVAMLVFSACSPSHKGEVDRLNSLSYAFHYRNLDSTKVLATRALALAEDYPAGYAEACNNLAFVAIAKMDYRAAKRWLEKVEDRSDNQIELLIADVQNMRICQREARNKDFYSHREKAMRRLRRIGEEASNLPLREHRRAIYAKSEFDIVAATYFYYVQQERPMQQALAQLDPDELEQDTAQYLNYLYNYGSGGAITRGTANEISQAEFDYLIRLYMMASGSNPYPYWQANALQAISEHIQDAERRDFLVKNNLPAFQYLNVEQMPTELLAGNFAQRALNLFSEYGDVYQTAGAYRTLAECYWQIRDYNSAGNCLNLALTQNKAILQAPDLVASIRERLCLVYSAIDKKPQSDYNRNIYLDLQEQARQDKQLEARAAQLDNNAVQLNSMIAAVIFVIILVVFLLYLFDRMKRRKARNHSVDDLLVPLHEWEDDNKQTINALSDKYEEVNEARDMVQFHISENRRRNMEQRAKVSLVNSITPFIDRMIHEVDRLQEGGEPEATQQERYQYISELADQINQYNGVLTDWIQMRQGSISLRIESFPLQPLFDIVAKGKMSFQMRGVNLEVLPTDAVVKADRTLTLFMINTIADNARKFTPSGGKVLVSAQVVDVAHAAASENSQGAASKDSYVEISIADTGKGMDETTLAHVFDRTYTGGHGFGLLNCKGIIDKYRKMSSLFSVCQIHAESEEGKGSRFSFRLPCGIRRMQMVLVLGLTMLFTAMPAKVQAENSQLKMQAQNKLHHQHHGRNSKNQKKEAGTTHFLELADAYADSAYFSNINGTYQKTLEMADSARTYLNRFYLSIHPDGKYLMVSHPKKGTAAEIQWLHDGLPTNYDVILDIRNECAVAALALHKWELYESNNKVYTQLFRERSADNSLDDYVRTMQVSENSKAVAIVLLIILLLQLPLAYYLLYYRHILRYRYAVDKINAINKVLLSRENEESKLQRINQLWNPQNAEKIRNSQLFPQLNKVVEQILQALRKSIDMRKNEAMNIEMAEDDLHRAEYENGKLHIANSVLDNCLSTLKHETMYYPSRIRQLIDTTPEDVTSLHELVDYYKSIYNMLSRQAMEQVEGTVKCDRDLLNYLKTLLVGGVKNFTFRIREDDENHHPAADSTSENGARVYATCQYILQDVDYDEKKHPHLFTPLTSDMKYLVARQIVREIGETTNLRGCGIQAKPSEEGKLMIEIVFPRKIIDINRYK